VIDRNFMPIGRFALSCRLSVKALRHYDKLGLLKPAFVDPQSKYRYYSREQARSAVMIGMLRSLSLPIPASRQNSPSRKKHCCHCGTSLAPAGLLRMRSGFASIQSGT
jgi:hypothetical protein